MNKNKLKYFQKTLCITLLAFSMLGSTSSLTEVHATTIPAQTISQETKNIINSGSPVIEQATISNNVKITLDGNPLNLTVPVISIRDRTFLPLRNLLTSIGVSNDNINWVSTKDAGEFGTAKAVVGNKTLEIPIGYDQGTIITNGNAETKEIYPGEGISSTLYNNYTYLPIRFTLENLNYRVTWVESTKTIKIFSPGYVEPTTPTNPTNPSNPSNPTKEEMPTEPGYDKQISPGGQWKYSAARGKWIGYKTNQSGDGGGTVVIPPMSGETW